MPVIVLEKNKFSYLLFKKERERSNLGFKLVFCDVFEIKFVEMGESTITAPDRKMPAADGQVVRSGDTAIPARCGFNELPKIITADLCEGTFFTDILNTGNEHAGRSTVIAGNLGLVRNRFDDLVSNFLAMITISMVPCEDEPVAHG